MFPQFFIWLYRTCTQSVDIYTATAFPYAQVCGGSSAVHAWTVPWLGLLFSGLSPQWRGFSPRPFNRGFMVDTVAVLPVPLQVLQILSVSVIALIHQIHYSNIYPTRCNVSRFILSVNCSTCFGWYLHPSSGAQTTVSTASGICQTVTATCRYSGR